MADRLSFLRTEDYVQKAEEALEREPLPSDKDDPKFSAVDRATIEALHAIAQAILALAKKK